MLADVMFLPIWATLLFAASMYPVGFMLGAPCSRCCGCNLCTGGKKLPQTLTVTFDNLPDSDKGPYLCFLKVSSCFGSGASVVVEAPGGMPGVDSGPISKVSITNGGSGYALLGRVKPTVTASGSGNERIAPTITATAPTGEGAILGVTLAHSGDYWLVDRVNVKSGGSGYANGSAVEFSISKEDKYDFAAFATIQTSRTTPSLTAKSDGTAKFSLTYEQVTWSPDTWGISSVSVTDPGTGSVDGRALNISLGEGDVDKTPAVAVLRTVRQVPSIGLSVNSQLGTNAILAPTLSSTQDAYGFAAWGVSGISVIDGGSGYFQDDKLSVVLGDESKAEGDDFDAVVTSVDENGAILEAAIASGGMFFHDSGVADSVQVLHGGNYYKHTGVIESVTVSSGGLYWRPSETKLNVTLENKKDNCGVDYWSVSALTVASDGGGHKDGEAVTFSVAPPGTVGYPATAGISTSRAEPTLTMSCSGTATFEITYDKSTETPYTWSLSDVTVASGGIGGVDGEQAVFSLGDGDTQIAPAAAIVYTTRTKPTVIIRVSSMSGDGAYFRASLNKTTDGYSRDVWEISSIEILSGGSGYAENEWLYVETDTVSEVGYLEAYVSGVSQSGRITDIAITNGGLYYADTGVVEGVDLFANGKYYKSDGQIKDISLTYGGNYWQDDASATPYVATPTVEILQVAPSDGSGAVLTPVVNSKVGDADFGKITGMTITNPGDGYLAWEWIPAICCGWYWNGKPVVVMRTMDPLAYLGDNSQCIYAHRMCGGQNNRGAKGFVAVKYRGPNKPPVAWLITERDYNSDDDTYSSRKCDAVFKANENVVDCSQWSSVSFSEVAWAEIGEDEPNIVSGQPGSATASVSAGGEYDQNYKAGNCHVCCQGEPLASEISVNIQDFSDGLVPHGPDFPHAPDFSGTYVLSRVAGGDPAWEAVIPNTETFDVEDPMNPGNVNTTNPQPGTYRRVRVWLEACPSQCVECIKKCLVRAKFDVNYIGNPAYPVLFPFGEDSRLECAPTENFMAVVDGVLVPMQRANPCEYCTPAPSCANPPQTQVYWKGNNCAQVAMTLAIQ